METTILIADDEDSVRLTLKEAVEAEHFIVLDAKSADECFTLATETRPDLILSDVVMPAKDGFALCRELKGDHRTRDIPVILLSGILLAEEDQVRGLEQGADDYLLKPIYPQLLLSKIRAVLRRYRTQSELRDLLSAEDLTLNVQSWTVTVKNKPVHLTRKEFDLLTLFLQHRGDVLQHAYLFETVWGLDPRVHMDLRTIKVHVSSLRKKLGARLGRRIVNVHGVGYRLDA